MIWGIVIGLILFFVGVLVMLFGIALLSYDPNSEWLPIPNVSWISIPFPEWMSIPTPSWILVNHDPYQNSLWAYMICGIGVLSLGTCVIFISNRFKR